MKDTKKSYLVFAVLPLLCFVVVFFLARTKRAPAIQFPNGTVYKFGAFPEGTTSTASFLFKNNGGKPLVIKDIKTDCACSKAKAQKPILQPGESSEIAVTYTTQVDGERRKQVIKGLVHSNDPDNEIVAVSIVGEVEKLVFWSPPAVSFFWEQEMIGKQQKIRFQTVKDKILTITKVEPSSDRIIVSCEEQGGVAECTISVRADCPVGNWDDSVNLVASVGATQKPINIPVHLMIK